MKPWALIPAPVAHYLAPHYLSLYGHVAAATGRVRTQNIPKWKSLDWRGLHFANPVGLAAGADKDARNLRAWWALGAGFLEIGTVTPQPQSALSGAGIARDFRQRALWNRLGFPSAGAPVVFERLTRLKAAYPVGWPTPVFVNIGKNRATPNAQAGQDYKLLIDTFYPLADALVLNISSPNTEGLRELLKPSPLREFLGPLVTARNERGRGSPNPSGFKPLLLKLSPDMTEAELRFAVHLGVEFGMEGFVLTNTTMFRPAGSPFPKEGGVSGSPLAPLAEAALRIAAHEVQRYPSATRPLLISVGGILSSEDIQRRLDLGAQLVQVYSALILEGPHFFRRCVPEVVAP